jgi:hypothetical protein
MATHAGVAIAQRKPVASVLAPVSLGRGASAFEGRRLARTAY